MDGWRAGGGRIQEKGKRREGGGGVGRRGGKGRAQAWVGPKGQDKSYPRQNEWKEG
jgi:hypothetical protein